MRQPIHMVRSRPSAAVRLLVPCMWLAMTLQPTAGGATLAGRRPAAMAARRATPVAGAASQSADPAIAEILAAVRDAYSGERARQTVAFVEQFWRLPGNEGFDASIERVASLLDAAGYVRQERAAPDAPLTYRIERRPLEQPTWEPVDASLQIVGDEILLRQSTNRNMVAINSYSTPGDGIEAEVVDVGDGSPERFEGLDVAGKIVFGESSVGRLFREAVQRRGAAGVLSYDMPSYTRPQVNTTSIQFSSIPLDEETRGWGLRLSYAAREALRAALQRGPLRARVRIDTRIYPSEELTLVADVHGRTAPDQRLVFSAHVQEPGANDNASGVGALAEGARVIAELVRDSRFTPERTITMLWGDEISSTGRYLQEDPQRAEGVRWGISLDMVGEDTAKTGGTFLIEKMPDPSAIWTRGADHHTEWGGRPLSAADMTPHYLNDFVLARCREQAAATGWVVDANPFEGGSDHVPFLRAGKPGLLLWHFTDQYYHTDLDRLDKVSARTLKNVGVCALVSAMTLVTADGETARFLIGELRDAALRRLQTEYELSRAAIDSGADAAEQIAIVRAWADWYDGALRTTEDIEVGGASPQTHAAIDAAVREVASAADGYLQRLRGDAAAVVRHAQRRARTDGADGGWRRPRRIAAPRSDGIVAR